MNKDKISKLGYKKSSPYKNRESLTIGSNFITTEDMAFPILAMGDGGETKILFPNTGSYLFPNSTSVKEFKLDPNTTNMNNNMMAQGGMMNEYEILSSYLPTLSSQDQDRFIANYEKSSPSKRQEILMKCGGMMKYQDGGQVMPQGMQVSREMANAEVEGGETAMDPNGVLMKFNGPSHENGGIPTILEGGTKVFSDHLKVPIPVQKELGIKRPNKKITYADISKRFPTEKHMQTLADTEDKYKKNAAEIQLQKNLAMLETLFFAQEQDKMMKEMSNPANMQMQAPMTNDGLQYAQTGTEIPIGQRIREARASLYPFATVAGVAVPFLGPGIIGDDGRVTYNINKAKKENSVVAIDAARQFLKPNQELTGYYKNPSEFGNNAQSKTITLPENAIVETDLQIPSNSNLPTDINENPIQDLSSISDRFTVLNDKFVMDPATGKYYVRFSDGTYGPAEGKIEIEKFKNKPKSTGAKTQRSPQQAQFDQMWGEEMYDLARNNSNIVLPNSGLYTSETGGRDIPVDISIPKNQSSRGRGVYGEQDWTKGALYADFESRFKNFLAQNPNYNPTKKGATAIFQNWHNAESDRLGIERYFDGKKKFSGVDDKFGQYTWSAPAFGDTQNLPGPVTTSAPVQSPAPAPAPASAQSTPVAPAPFTPAQVAPKIEEVPDAITKERYPFGINPKLLGSAIDAAVVLSDRLSIDSPALYNRQKNPMFNRFYEFDNLETQRQANQQIQAIMNSNMPEQVKQAQIAQITAQSQDQQARVDFANAQRYEQKRETDLAKLQTYTDANLDTRIADYDNWRQRMARVKDMQNQFKSWRKQQLVGTLKDQLGYMEKLKSVNDLNPYFERSWLTGTDRYKPQGPNIYGMDPTQGYDKNVQKQITLPGGATVSDMGDFYVIVGADGVPKIQEKKEQKSNKMTKEQAAAMYGFKYGGFKY